MTKLRMKFIQNAVARSACTVAIGIAALNHKAVDNPVKNQTVIKFLFRQFYKVLRGAGNLVRKQFNRKGSHRGREHGSGIFRRRLLRRNSRRRRIRFVFGLRRSLFAGAANGKY